MPTTAGPVQIEETRRAFYAGSYITLMSIATGIEQETPDDEGVEMLMALKVECETFLGNVKNPEPPPVEPADIHYTVPDPLDIQTKLKDARGVHQATTCPRAGVQRCCSSATARRAACSTSRARDRADVLNVMREFIKPADAMSGDDDMLLRGLEPFVLVGIIVAIVVLLILAFAMGSYEHAARRGRRQPARARVHERAPRASSASRAARSAASSSGPNRTARTAAGRAAA